MVGRFEISQLEDITLNLSSKQHPLLDEMYDMIKSIWKYFYQLDVVQFRAKETNK